MRDWFLQRFAQHHAPLGDPVAFDNPCDALKAANQAILVIGVAQVAVHHAASPKATATISEALTPKELADLLAIWGYVPASAP